MAEHPREQPVTTLLLDWRQGNREAGNQLLARMQPELRRIAAGYMQRERSGHTLQATALVHETFKQLLGVRKITLNDRAHFYTFAAKLMRRLLIDHARRWRAAKRGIDFTRVPLNPELAWVNPATEEVLDLSAALEELESLDVQRVRAVELHYFLGCTITETAALLNTSPSTIDRALRFSLAWLRARLHPPA